MKQFRLLLTALLLWVGGANVAWAQEWSSQKYTINGIDYYLSSSGKAKIAINKNYSGIINIPEYVYEYNSNGTLKTFGSYGSVFRVTDYETLNLIDPIDGTIIYTPFNHNSNITEVHLPKSIRLIKDEMFRDCSSLAVVYAVDCYFATGYKESVSPYQYYEEYPIGLSKNVFLGCTNLTQLYTDDERALACQLEWVEAHHKKEYVCNLTKVLGATSTNKLNLYHNQTGNLATYLQGYLASENKFGTTTYNVTNDFYPNGDAGYIDYLFWEGYYSPNTGGTIYRASATYRTKPINQSCTIKGPQWGSKTFVVKNYPSGVKPYISIDGAEAVPMVQLGDSCVYSVPSNGATQKEVRLQYRSTGIWSADLSVQTSGHVDIFVNNTLKVEQSQSGTYTLATASPYATFDIDLRYDDLRYTITAKDETGRVYTPVLTNGKYRFTVPGGNTYEDYHLIITAVEKPIEVRLRSSKQITVNRIYKGKTYNKSYQGNKLFKVDSGTTVGMEITAPPTGYKIKATVDGAALGLVEHTNAQGQKYYTTSYTPDYGKDNVIDVVECPNNEDYPDGLKLSINITKVGDGLFNLREENSNWYEALDENNPEELVDMELDGETQSFEWLYDRDDIQNLYLFTATGVYENGVQELVRVTVNDVNIEPYDSRESPYEGADTWYWFKVPVNDFLDIQLITESNGRHLIVRNSDKGGNIEVFDANDESVLVVSPVEIGKVTDLVKQSGYYAIITPSSGKKLNSVFTTGMKQPELNIEQYKQQDGTYRVPLDQFDIDGNSDYTLFVSYEDGAVDPWISYHHEGVIGSLGSLVNSLPESQKNAIEQLSVSMNMRAKDLEAIRYLGGKPNYYTKPDTQGSLYSLDLTDAVFYESGEVFYTDESREYKINTRNVMPYGFLAGLHLETLHLPKALQGFEEGALMNVNNHLVVYAPWKTPLDLSTSSGFGDEVAQMDLYVPAGSFDAYAADAEWSKFGFIWEYGKVDPLDVIQFADPNVKAICVENWDTNGDGELSKAEAKAVTSLEVDGTPVFKGKATITSFNEFQYFKGLTALPDYAFQACTKLESIVMPDSLATLGQYAFFGCEKLNSIVLPKNITVLPMFCFAGCNAFTSFTVPEGVTTILNNAFRNCKGITSISFPQTLTKLEGAQFDNARQKIKTLVIPKSVTNLGASGLVSNFDNLVVESGNTKYDSREGCGCIIETTSNKILYGSNNARIPNGIKIINAEAFKSLKDLKKIELPNTIISIGNYAFAYTDSLKSVVSKIEDPTKVSLGSDAFKGISPDCILTVPKGTKEAYILAGWTTKETDSNGVFLKIEEAASTLKGDVNGDGKVSIADAVEVVNIILGNPAANARMRILEELEQE